MSESENRKPTHEEKVAAWKEHFTSGGTWGGVELVPRAINDAQVAQLRRLNKFERDQREILKGILLRPAMYIGIGKGHPFGMWALTMTVEWVLRDLTALVSSHHHRDFYKEHNFGALGLHKVIDENKTWEENIASLEHWIKKYLNWLESPLDTMTRQITEPD